MADNSDIPSAYVRDKRTPPPSREELRARIPGWGADLDPADRPSHPKLQYAPDTTGAHWDFPERQPEKWPRERSIEHAFVTPVFGTAQPLKGVSGKVRRLSYDRFSEARIAHWMLLIAGDRIDALGAHARSLASLRPDNPITQTGIRAEFTHHGLESRRSRTRADRLIQAIDPVIVAGPWLLAAGGIGWTAAKVARRLR
jgi:hypothetical protein